jgi:hypothetical protein
VPRLLLPVIHAMAVGVALAALASLDTSVAFKVIVLFFGGLLVAILFALLELHEVLTRIYTTQRLTFVSVEKRRLDHSDKSSAAQILNSDLEAEAAGEAVERKLGGAVGGRAAAFALYIIVLVTTFAVAVYLWHSDAV